MNHKIRGHRLARCTSHRMSLLANLSVSLIEHGRIKTTLAKAKALRPFFEKMFTKARVNSLQSRRLLLSRIRNEKAVSKLLNDIALRNPTRPGGYCRIMKAGYRVGDNAPMALIELVD